MLNYYYYYYNENFFKLLILTQVSMGVIITSVHPLLLRTVAIRNGIYSRLALAEKGKFRGLDIVSQKKTTTEPKLLILASFFSGGVTSYNDTSYCIHILWEVCCSISSGPPCIGNSNIEWPSFMGYRKILPSLGSYCTHLRFVHYDPS